MQFAGARPGGGSRQFPPGAAAAASVQRHPRARGEDRHGARAVGRALRHRGPEGPGGHAPGSHPPHGEEAMTGQLQECPVCAGTGYLSIVRGRNGATRPMPALHTAPRDLPHVIAEAFRETLEPVTGERRAEIAQVVEDVRLGYARLEEWPPLSVLGNLALELGLPAFPLDRGKPTGRLAYECILDQFAPGQ